jgi:lysine 2,3-aminomutase
MNDITEIIEKSTICHGKTSDRIYLMKLSPENAPQLIPKLDKLAEEMGYTKIFAKVQVPVLPVFISNDYEMEAFIPRFFDHKTDCALVSKFMDKKRKKLPANELALLQQFTQMAKKNGDGEKKYPMDYMMRPLKQEDAALISGIFKEVFKTYPFPVHDPAYIVQTMKNDDSRYFGVWDGKKLIGVSSAEIDLTNKNAEMTDFAVLPGYRGQNIAYRLLAKMEIDMKRAGIKTCYTIARLNQPGMNKTFLKSGYEYTGTLVNNTNIGGNIESMNILYKYI